MSKNYIAYIASLLLFGSNGIVAGFIALPSYEIVFWRTMIGSILLVALFALSRQKPSILQFRHDSLFIVFSGIAMGASWILLYEAYQRIGVGLSSLAYYTGPVIVMVLSPFVFKERLTARKLIGFAIVVAGVALVNGSAAGNIDTFGLLCGFGSAAMYSFMVMLNKKSANIKGLENATIQLVAAFLTTAVFVALKNGFQFQSDPTNLGWIVFLGLVNTGLGCYLYFSSIGRLPVQTVAMLGYLEPLSAVVLALIILGEVMLPLQMLGAALIIGGALIGEVRRRPKSEVA